MDGLFHGILGGMQHVLPTSAENFIALLVGVPGLGVVLLVLLLIITGMLVTNMVGAWWLVQWNRLLSHIPIVKSIYVSVKQVSDTLFSTNGNAFREAVLVQYPREGSWTIAFVTGRPSGEVAAALPGEHVSLYVPTTPNPTSGFFLMVPRAACLPLRMSVDEALKYIISMGVVSPPAGIRVPPVGADPNRVG
jgi:uncharacterized membrane protein